MVATRAKSKSFSAARTGSSKRKVAPAAVTLSARALSKMSTLSGFRSTCRKFVQPGSSYIFRYSSAICRNTNLRNSECGAKPSAAAASGEIESADPRARGNTITAPRSNTYRARFSCSKKCTRWWKLLIRFTLLCTAEG
ncbi:PP4 [Orf virus]|uniref:PP4 n=1 Tax=Orf virus TaxID=10258 RepID=F1AXJ1_ORFV|nr:PP4 [Orf virus]